MLVWGAGVGTRVAGVPGQVLGHTRAPLALPWVGARGHETPRSGRGLGGTEQGPWRQWLFRPWGLR